MYLAFASPKKKILKRKKKIKTKGKKKTRKKKGEKVLIK